ncbi:hypothetical protein ABLN87_22405, partial [Ruegeria sp. SCPT10]|uniref:hypothetical protein n=1 Tax=Ruegeria sp. SCP10 TaxID=3141377 RepID=UPI00333B0678
FPWDNPVLDDDALQLDAAPAADFQQTAEETMTGAPAVPDPATDAEAGIDSEDSYSWLDDVNMQTSGAPEMA